MDELKEKIARSLCLGMYGMPSRDYDKLHDDSKEELRISAAAALRAIEEAGYVVVPKNGAATLRIETAQVNPPKPVGCGIFVDGKMVLVAPIDELRAAAVRLQALEEPRG